MAKPLNLTVLYTSNLRGDLHLLPRLYAFMQRLKPPRRQGVLLLDLGGACDDDVWHCRLTQGRSMLIALDGMGCHAANVAGTLDAEGIRKIEGQITMGLVDAGRGWHYQIPPIDDRSIIATLRPTDEAARLQICLSAADETALRSNALYLGDVRGGQVGRVCLDLHPVPRIITSEAHDLPPDTPPNPTIAGAVEFVESEARYLQRKRG